MQRLIGGLVLSIIVLLSACSTNGVREENPKTQLAQTNVELGVGYLQQGNRKYAMEKLNKALKLDPNLASAHHAIALAYQQSGQMELAEKHFLRALQLDPKDGALHNNYGGFLCGEMRLDEAEAQFKQALNDPAYDTPARALENAGLCMLRKPNPEKAAQYFRKALEINPKLPSSLFELAKISLEKKNYLPARAYLQRLQEVSSATPQSLWIGIQIERELGNTQAVTTYAAELKSKFPNSNEIRMLRESNGGS